MIIDLKNLKLLPFTLCSVVVIQASISFTTYAFLMPASYLCLGLMLLGFLIMTAIMLRHPRISLFDFTVFSFFFFLLLFSFLNRTDFKNALYLSISVCLVLLLFNYYRHKIDLLIQSFAFAFSCCIYANSLLPLLFPDIIFSADNFLNSFLLGGNHNQMGSRMIVGIVLSLLCNNYSRRWFINSILLITISILTLGIVGSMTSLAAIAAFLIIILIPSLQLKKVMAVGYFVFFFLFQVVIVFSGEGLHNNELAVYIIEDVLGKDMSFTGRVIMWDAAARVFVESPLIGYGYVDKEWYFSNLSKLAIGTHNFIYTLLIFGGMTLLSLFIAIFVIATRKLIHKADSQSLMIFLSIDTFLVMSLMETYPLFFIFMLLTLAYYYPRIRESWNQQGSTEETVDTLTIKEDPKVQE